MLNKLAILFLVITAIYTQAATTNIIGATNVITLTVNPPLANENVVSYDVALVMNNVTNMLFIKNFTNTLFFTFTNLIPSQFYTFSAQAINNFGARSDWSEPLYVLTKPSAPSNLRAITNVTQVLNVTNNVWENIGEFVVGIPTNSSALVRGKLLY